jgi:Flp pilus assembly protein TadD
MNLKLHPHSAATYVNLGNALQARQDLKGALAAYRQAIKLDPRFGKAYYNLGIVLGAKGDMKGAVTAFRQAIQFDPQYAGAHFNLGIALKARGDLKGAAAAFRKAGELDPKDAETFFKLGVVLFNQQDRKGAVAAFRQAIALNPRDAQTHFNLGIALEGLQDLKAAVAAYRQAIAVNPKYASAHLNLGILFYDQGRFTKALACLRQGRTWLPGSDRRRTRLKQLIRECRHCSELEKRLPDVLRGKAKPAGAPEQLEFARLCSRQRKYATAARFYEQGFAADGKLADALQTGNRFKAACAAAQAAAGLGNDAAKLSEPERNKCRRQSLAWLQADLALWRKHLDSAKAKERREALQMLRHWQDDADLAGVRGPKALAKLSAADRAPWRQFWQDVETLIQKAK